ncbi:MAG: ATP-binding cassette domain-containing protein, partial [Actinomycetota bacterium]|nr:ATP-binding cassette domain-containing protein [Actinomycetota bacterium]
MPRALVRFPSRRSQILQIRDVAVDVAGRTVVDGATFTIAAGDKIGLVGRNGAGKTSLLKVLAGQEPPAAGGIVRKGAMGYLTQDPRAGHQAEGTALEHVIAGRGILQQSQKLEKLRSMLEENPSRSNIATFAKAEERYRTEGGYAAEGDARRIAAGLGLPQDRLDLPLNALSGGERRRVELARILFAGSDLLLLDEPTNHLDTDAKNWLMKFLAGYRGGLLVVSHDIGLLDKAITRVLHLDESHLVEYKGTYSQYRVARKADEARIKRVVQRQQSEITRLKTLADSMRGQTQRRARTARSIDTRVARLRRDAIESAKGEKKIAVSFPEPPRAGRTVLKVDGLSKSYGGPPVFEELSFDVERGERLLVMGLNGAGKTSLLRILAGQSAADAGEVALGYGVSLGYYAQEHEGIHAGMSVIDHMRSISSETEQKLRALLGMFGLTGAIASQDAGTLSGGEKTKLALAQLVAGRHNLLLLDEPTNNLDPAALEAVADSLSMWPGSMVIVSHDRDFVAALGCDRALM